jgi:hypothetical protein
MINYSEYILEKKLEKLFEAKISLSKSFSNLLMNINSPLSKKILDLQGNEVDVQYNYIDSTEENDTVSFTPERKVQEVIANKEELYKVVNSGKYLTGSKSNQHIYDRLNHERTDTVYQPETGVIGKILGKTIGTNGRTYVLFECTKEGEIGRRTILNIDALESTDDTFDRIWTSHRNKIKIGRVIKAILNASKIQSSDAEIEKFVNQYKSTVNVLKDAFSRFDIVKDTDILHWYSKENYEVRNKGTLANSCMSEVPNEYLNLYSKNTDVCQLVILYSEKGKVQNGKLISDTITGRALLWTCRDGRKFMDRIYTTLDSDVDLFKKFAEKNGWWFKLNQNSGDSFTIVKATELERNPILIVDLQHWNLEKYPYLDSLMYLNSYTGELSNRIPDIEANKYLQNTNGTYNEIEPEDDETW